jgi:oxygen-dependent protoporphyrinogen oxidase
VTSRDTRRPDHVVVVGGGIAGLTAALRLTQAGSLVTVVEPGRLGGKLQTSVFAGRAVDETADNFLLRVPWAVALCHDLELDGELVSPLARRAEIFLDGTRRAMPEGHVLGVPVDLDALAASGLLSPEGLARVARDLELPRLPTDPPATASDHTPSGPGAPATTVSEAATATEVAAAGAAAATDHLAGSRPGDVAIGPYLRGRLGDEAVDHLIDPLIGGINAGDTARLSLAAVVPQIDAAARTPDPSLIRSCAAQVAAGSASTASPAASASGAPPVFATPIGGMARLVDAVVAAMPSADLRTGVAVTALEPTGTGRAPGAGTATPWRVTLSDGTALAADAVVVACPAWAAAPLLAPVAPDAAAVLADVDHSSISMVTLAFDRPALAGAALPEGISGCLVPRDQGTLLTAVSYGSAKWAQWRHPERDDVVLRASAGRTGDHRHLDLDDADLVARVVADLDRVVGVAADPTAVRVGRWERSFPQYAPGHLDRIDAVEADLAAVSRRAGGGLVLAGAALRGVGIPACIRSGELAAEVLGATWPTRRSLRR